MRGDFDFVIKQGPPSSTANVFVHGYSAGHSVKDREQLLGSIPDALSADRNIFAFWDSNHFGVLSDRAKSNLGKDLLRIVKSDNRLRDSLAPSLRFIENRARNFFEARARADKIGGVFFRELDRYLQVECPEVERVNLVGHSLGGRVLVNALKAGSSGISRSVSSVLLLGAAVRLSAEEAKRMRLQFDARIVNVYSKQDLVLLLNSHGNALGRNPVEHFDNVQLKGFGHTDYWPRLGSVLERVSFFECSGLSVDVARTKKIPV